MQTLLPRYRNNVNIQNAKYLASKRTNTLAAECKYKQTRTNLHYDLNLMKIYTAKKCVVTFWSLVKLHTRSMFQNETTAAKCCPNEYTTDRS